MDEQLAELAGRVAERLSGKGVMLAAAESCTGGWVAKVCTDLTGSSGWFERGFVTYSNEAKQEMLGVSPRTLATHGAVSEAAVREMASGALARSRARVTLAISGVAGPGGGTDRKPVGTVWFAWATADRLQTQHECFGGDREAVRRAAVITALEGVLEIVGT
ncbi:nicotinamide-nucleotide amidase [Thiohalomonas denitrificans]|uniref:Nicotinamide-nucleotide amidase n=2 Tax=Thiohalomonas denitrificans TaxID=415747 RepID=A0A1G5PKM8_9GAMM|nr:nicotinamide-nucleotide amidase [Thiohalomonas denitrificans]